MAKYIHSNRIKSYIGRVNIKFKRILTLRQEKQGAKIKQGISFLSVIVFLNIHT